MIYVLLAVVAIGVYFALKSVGHIEGCTCFCRQGREECTCK